ncbi:hypothetical protein BTR23_10750 [Alkalihalophilus pseudofirmus]|nr:hypothetical protein BTR23_10750 [Alkalihalophilus pseudofirmus]
MPNGNEHKNPQETHIVETKTLKNKKLRQEQVKKINQVNINELDQSSVPDHVPTLFVKAVKPFFNRATDICGLWNRAQIEYRSAKPPKTPSIDVFLPTLVGAVVEGIVGKFFMLSIGEIAQSFNHLLVLKNFSPTMFKRSALTFRAVLSISNH